MPSALIMIHIITKPKPRSVYNRGKIDFFDFFVVVDREMDIFTALTAEVLVVTVRSVTVPSDTVGCVFCLILTDSVVDTNEG